MKRPPRKASPFMAGCRVRRDYGPLGVRTAGVVAVLDQYVVYGRSAYQMLELLVDGDTKPYVSAWLGWERAS